MLKDFGQWLIEDWHWLSLSLGVWFVTTIVFGGTINRYFQHRLEMRAQEVKNNELKLQILQEERLRNRGPQDS